MLLVAHNRAQRVTVGIVLVAYLPVNIVGRKIGKVFSRIAIANHMVEHFHRVIFIVEVGEQHFAIHHQIRVSMHIFAGDVGNVVAVLLQPPDHVEVAAVKMTGAVILLVRAVIRYLEGTPTVGIVIVEALATPVVVGLPRCGRHHIHQIRRLAVIPHHKWDIRHVVTVRVLQPDEVDAAYPVIRHIQRVRDRPVRIRQPSHRIKRR